MPNVHRNIVTFADEFDVLKSTIYAIIIEAPVRDIVQSSKKNKWEIGYEQRTTFGT